MIDGKPPFRKINLLSRKAKDERGVASVAQGGEYEIKSKNKIADPTAPSQKLTRGSKINVSMKSETIHKIGPTPNPTYQDKTIDVPVKKYIPGDFQKKIIDRPTTMEHGKTMNEAPAKTQMRINAQKEQKTSYTHGGKEEYAGRNETSSKQVKIKVPVMRRPAITTETITRPVTTVTKPVKAASQIIKRKQSFENTPWTSTKKQTKGYTSNPNSGGRTRIKWNGGKVKVN